jgi:hypothetical protein
VNGGSVAEKLAGARPADKVFKYTVAGSLLGSWTIDAANASPTGITINNDGDAGVKDKATDLSTFESQFAQDIDWLNNGL